MESIKTQVTNDMGPQSAGSRHPHLSFGQATFLHSGLLFRPAHLPHSHTITVGSMTHHNCKDNYAVALNP